MKRSEFKTPMTTMLIDLNSQAAYEDRGDPARKAPRLLPVPKETVAEENVLLLEAWRKNVKLYPQLFFLVGEDTDPCPDGSAKAKIEGIGLGLAFSDDGILAASPNPSARDSHMCYWYALYSDNSQVLSDAMIPVKDARSIRIRISSPSIGEKVFDQKNLLFTPEETIAEGGRIVGFRKGDLISLGAADASVSMPLEKKFAEGEEIRISAEGFEDLVIKVKDLRDASVTMKGWSPREFYLNAEYRN